MDKKISSRLYLLSACFGNLFEHYDTALFSFLSPFLAPLIFPKHDPVTALILTYAMIPLGQLARPFGAVIFGHIGDTYGRTYALYLSLMGMAIISVIIAFTPMYVQIGALCPIIFCIGRVIQNFLASGETIGGAIFLLENTQEKKHDLLSSLYDSSTIGGILLASFAVTLTSHYGILDFSWRILYLLGAITAFFGSRIRKKIPSFVQKNESFCFSKFIKTLWNQRQALLIIIIASGFSYATYSIAVILMNGFIPLVTSFTKAEVMSINTALLVFDFFLLPIFGQLSAKIGREKVMLFSTLAVILTAIPLSSFLQNSSLTSIIIIRMCFVTFGVSFFASFHAWSRNLVPKRHRYTIISFGYALGSQLLGGPTAAISLWTFKQTGILSSICWYWVILATASCFSILYSYSLKSARLEEGNL